MSDVVSYYIPKSYTTVTQPLPEYKTAVPPARTFGIDVSRWQGAINWPVCFSEGVKFAAIRCTVGDYYTDPNFAYNWREAVFAGILVAPYLVVAPAEVTRKISAKQHWDYFMATFGERDPDLPIVLDCELTRDQSKAYITNLIAELIWNVKYTFGRFPLIYTRQTWWDFNTNASPEFARCALWAARYSHVLDGPWSDGKYQFRDWSEWNFWQYSEEGELDGIESAHVDLDYYNGPLESLLEYADGEQPAPVDPDPDIEARFDAIEAALSDLENEQELLFANVTDIMERLTALENAAPPVTPPEPEPEYITATAIDKVVAFSVDGYNAAGAPLMVKYEPLIRYDTGAQFPVLPVPLRADGGAYYYQFYRADGLAVYCRKDKVKL